MAVTMQQVRAILESEEPDYARGVKLGRAAIPHLVKLAQGRDPMLASKATSLAGMIGDDEALKVVRVAARKPNAAVRVAAAEALRNLEGPASEKLLATLVNDDDPSVRKIALRSVTFVGTEELRSALQTVGSADAHKPLRDAAKTTLRQKTVRRDR